MARLQSISAPLASSPNPISPGNSEIVDLSSPHGSSVNDAIPPELASLHYPRVDQTAALIAQHGWGALIAKLDLHSAYRKIPVHPDDSMLLGIKWLDTIYIDRALPFGLRSASKLFTAVADGFAWALVARGYPDFTHYLDDYLFWSAHDSPACREALNTALKGGAEGVATRPTHFQRCIARQCVGSVASVLVSGRSGFEHPTRDKYRVVSG